MSNRFKPHLWFVSAVGRIVPRRFRSEWKQEWEAELHHRETLLRQWRRSDANTQRSLLLLSVCSIWDALAMQPRRLEEEIFQDLRYGVRTLLQSKGWTAVAALSLALGIGEHGTLQRRRPGVVQNSSRQEPRATRPYDVGFRAQRYGRGTEGVRLLPQR